MLQLINDDDQVVAATAIDLVREKELWNLTDDVEFVLAHRDPKDWYVFEAASWTLASRRLTADRRRELWLEPLPAAALVGRLRGLPMFASVGIDELFRIVGAGHQVRKRDGHNPAARGRGTGQPPRAARRPCRGDLAPDELAGDHAAGDARVRGVAQRQPDVAHDQDARTLSLAASGHRSDAHAARRQHRPRAGVLPHPGRRIPGSGERSVMKGDAGEELARLAGGQLTPIQKVLALQRISVFFEGQRHRDATPRGDRAPGRARETRGALRRGRPPCGLCRPLGGVAAREARWVHARAAGRTRRRSRDARGAGRYRRRCRRTARLTVAESGAALRIDHDDPVRPAGTAPGSATTDLQRAVWETRPVGDSGESEGPLRPQLAHWHDQGSAQE